MSESPPPGPQRGPAWQKPGGSYPPSGPQSGPAWGPASQSSWNQRPPDLPAGADWGFKDRKLPAGICGLLFGALGVHKFILGYIAEGVIMASVTIVGWIAFFVAMLLPLAFEASEPSGDAQAGWLVVMVAVWAVVGVALVAVGLVGFIEGIIYLTKSDRDFVVRYSLQRHGWF